MMHFVVPTRPAGGIGLNGETVISDRLAKECLKVYYSDKESAVRAATDYAVKNPTVQFAVMSPDGIFETLVPKVIRKKLTENGEIVLDEEPQA